MLNSFAAVSNGQKISDSTPHIEPYKARASANDSIPWIQLFQTETLPPKPASSRFLWKRSITPSSEDERDLATNRLVAADVGGDGEHMRARR